MQYPDYEKETTTTSKQTKTLCLHSSMYWIRGQTWNQLNKVWFFVYFCTHGILDPHSRAPKKNTSHENGVLPKDTTHLIQRPCYQRGSPCQDPAVEFCRSQRAMENREKWSKLVAKSSVVPQRPSRLGHRWGEGGGGEKQTSICLLFILHTSHQTTNSLKSITSVLTQIYVKQNIHTQTWNKISEELVPSVLPLLKKKNIKLGHAGIVDHSVNLSMSDFKNI